MGLKNHGYIPKKRNTNDRTRKSLFVISTEGKNKTERLYFKQLNSKKVQIRFSKGRATDPLGMISELIREMKEIDFQPDMGDKAYCVLDSDFLDIKNEQIAIADKKACSNNINVIVSAPCFEVWYLCHFLYSTKQYRSSDEVIKELEKYIPGYTKSMEGIYERLLPLQVAAVKNAKKLEEYLKTDNKKPHTVGFIPSTEVYKIIGDYQAL
ncbi:MAG: RloB family protein [Eubacteriales bacterium]|nr:RloB family protein [Eubacteriales bacterium]